MSDNLHSDLWAKILLRLSAESLLQLRRVCKEWRDIINCPSFIKSHTENQPYTHTLLVRNIVNSADDVPLFVFSVDSLDNAIEGSQTIEATPIRDLLELDPYLAASCNGLFLLRDVDDGGKSWAMWNPLTWDYYWFPAPDVSTGDLNGYGLGYDDVSDDYKVVVSVIQKNVNVNQTQIYSLKLGSWRAITDFTYWVAHECQYGIGAFLDDTFYWISESQDKIVSLPLNTERYSQFPFPPIEEESDLNHLSLEALDGFLILCFCPDKSHFEGWVMNVEGWDKMFSVEIPVDSFIVRLVAYLKDKRQILVHLDRGFMDSSTTFAVHGFPYIDSCRIFSKSLVRLNAIGGPMNMENEFNEFRGEKLEFGVRDDEDPCGDDGLEFGICKNCLGD